MINKIVFFSLWHKGDLHVSRTLVKYVYDFARKNNIKCGYQHKYPDYVLRDVGVPKDSNNYGFGQFTRTFDSDGTLYLNTWYGGDEEIFNNKSVTFDALYFSFAKVMKKYFDVDMSTDYWSFFPEIDYSAYNISGIKQFMDEHPNQRKILISNGTVMSGQVENFDFNPTIASLSAAFPNTLFMVTNDEGNLPKAPNIIKTSSIIKNTGCDQNENSYVSTFCDAIIGRFSGSYTFSMTRHNYLRNVKFLVMCNQYQYPAWFHSLPMSPVAQIHSKIYTKPDDVYPFITSHI